MRVEGECGFEARVSHDLNTSVAVGEVEVRTGPIEDALVRLYRLAVLSEGFEGCAIDRDNDVVLLVLVSLKVCRICIE